MGMCVKSFRATGPLMSSGADINQYGQFLDTLPDGAMVVDSRGTIAFANSAASEFFGYQLDEMAGQPIEVLVPEPMREAHRGLVSQYSSRPRRRPMSSGLELSARRADGQLLPVDIMLSPIELNGIRYTVCIVRNMAERRRLEAELEAALAREKSISRTDPLTGAANRRRFTEHLQDESERSKRYNHPFSIAYLDLDHFKQVNDGLGHAIGDRLLVRVVETLKALSRSSDTVARVGGDEFAVLLPEADSAAARGAVEKFRSTLLAEMRSNDWPVTFSIGVITCITPPHNAQVLIEAADRLMYAVKEGGRDAVRYGEYAPT